MAGYRPLYVKRDGLATGLVQNRVEHILPDDAFPILENAYIFRERIRRKDGWKLLGRLQRNITSATSGSFTNSLLAPYEATSSLVPGSINITGSGGVNWTDPNADGVLIPSAITPNGTVNYATGVLTGPTPANTGSFSYYPNLPVMGIRNRELNATSVDQQIFFDTIYAYIFINNLFQEWLPGTVWSGTDYQFFWTTNYWSSPAPAGLKIFWATNFNWSTSGGDPLRYTDGTSNGWIDFQPQINAAGDFLYQALILIPFRGRLLAFNTWEGSSNGIQFSNRIRWAAIGTPITTVSTIFPSGINANAWRDDIQGQGGFLNIPTNEDITAVGFVRDNLVIYCENSTWQLRYTGRTIAPFQIEKVNSEFGSYSTFSAVQFDTSLLGIGDKGIIECDSFKSARIDIKIPDLVFEFNQLNNGVQRVSGARDFVKRLVYWTFCDADLPNNIYPTRRLLYNYENDSWAIFTDSLTTLGQFQPPTSSAWNNYPSLPWSGADFAWIQRPPLEYTITGGNTQGFVVLLDQQVSNDISLQVEGITGSLTAPIIVNSPLHNLYTLTDNEGEYVGQVIQFSGFLSTDPYFILNGMIFVANVIDTNNFSLIAFDPTTNTFSDQFTGYTGTYLGAATIAVLDNFNIRSKKFNYLDEGHKYQLGYIDILMNDTAEGEITLNIYNDYADDLATNQQSNEAIIDTFFNVTIPTSAAGIGIPGGSKNWQRVFCPTQANFVTIEYTLSPLQMTTQAQKSAVEIFSQIIWSRPAGRLGFVM
jgi:hypothetical protein